MVFWGLSRDFLNVQVVNLDDLEISISRSLEEGELPILVKFHHMTIMYLQIARTKVIHEPP
jgi:hypothetical protein